MNKKFLGLIGVIALGVGSVSAIALQSHAQNASAQATTTVTPASVNTATDTDNIQNDAGGVEKPDAVVSSTADKETNDDQGLVQDAEVNDGN